ncbi:hypothetical protein Tco_0704682 [Tanacetum coccineum]|uniref:Uncharacterized protein n=1 Tax=Tanacetum coccineum TaxID=301880 RepID=A0ABQ4Y3A1_9ASTR
MTSLDITNDQEICSNSPSHVNKVDIVVSDSSQVNLGEEELVEPLTNEGKFDKNENPGDHDIDKEAFQEWLDMQFVKSTDLDEETKEGLEKCATNAIWDEHANPFEIATSKYEKGIDRQLHTSCGHAEGYDICNHCYKHLTYTTKDEKQMEKEEGRVVQAIRKLSILTIDEYKTLLDDMIMGYTLEAPPSLDNYSSNYKVSDRNKPDQRKAKARIDNSDI